MKKHEGNKGALRRKPPPFTEGASAVHMLKMCQAMANLGIEVECVLPGRVKKGRTLSYYGIKTSFRVTSITLSGGAAKAAVTRFFKCSLRSQKKK